MNFKLLLTLTSILYCSVFYAQENRITIEDEQVRNRLLIYASNNTLTDLDVAITLKGTGFRQRSGVPRKVRVPGRSKVNLISVVIERGQEPKYTYTLDVNDSLTRRSLVKEFELIKIQPKKMITLYKPDNCTNCEALTNGLEESPFLYKTIILSENETIKAQLSPYVPHLETTDKMIVMLGGKLYPEIETAEALLEVVNE